LPKYLHLKENMRTIYFVFIVFLFAAFIHFACKDDVIPPKTNDDPGILRTDESGNILSGDSTDWCFKDTQTGFKFGPAFPNPVIGNIFHIKATLPQQDVVNMYFVKTGGDTIYVVNAMMPAGVVFFDINTVSYNFNNTYQRLYLKCNSYPPTDSCKNYGDIKFEE